MRPSPTDSTETQSDAADPAATNGAEARSDDANGNGNGATAAPSGRPTVVDTPQVDPLAAAGGSPGQRGALRRRLEKLRRELDKQRSELGTLVVDAKKRSPTARPKAVDVRAQAVADLEAQVAELAYAVEGDRPRRELRAGIAGTCDDCGRLIATEDRFCPKCGRPTKAKRARPVDAGPAQATDAAAAEGAPEATAPTDAPGPEASTPGDAPAPAGAAPDGTPEAATPSETPAAAADSATTAEFSAVGDTSENPAISRAALADAPPPTAGTEQRPKKRD